MKMNRALSLAMAGALGLSLLAGCGGGSGSATPAPADTSAPADHSGASGVIKIGGIGPLTGSAAVYGLATKQGAEVAVAEINALGGLQFSLDFQDDEGDAEKAVNAYNKLKGDGVQLIYGCTTTTPCVAVAAETFNDRYFQLTPSASSTDVTSGRDNVFQVCFTDPNQGLTAANYIKENGLGTKVAVIYNNGDAYSTGIYNAFQSEADAIGLEVVSVTTFPDDTNADFTVQLGEAQSAGADLVFMPIYYTPASLILNQAKTMGYAPTFFGCDGMDGILDLEGFDTSLAEGLMLMTPFNAWGTDERTVNFVTTYQGQYDGIPNQFAADGYDCIYAIYEACQKAGITADTSAADVCEALVSTFTSEDFSVDGLTGTGMTWSSTGEVSKAPVVVKVEGGVYVTQ
ncbi:Leucine-%2C isoleucine-%2C valine-%2C threonine-%2C and alanine-binding protein precursor [uncultured Clostridium sp.]|uniref:Amino acid/amide ABC transporter substrate-binding protein (HAAT family) n=4 Tax=Intestinimonas butyriciproducens TaxID=1297617 RepID=A0A2U1CG95_9FIRM|nr:amino acid/amide ABC transporter substrate-binding protein (HAAT family) [Intestinimonas butyriciproducens]QBB64459.1 Branched-chain amino acid ABC transporter, amino acid-binding protein [Intestinimonas butyriciproducens]SCJ56483.1 Leucine-%2C isoleucine-%2C valine-%2C threonine-%2C and alanine-binding protein precursor [uncultured Clostridium sp.]